MKGWYHKWIKGEQSWLQTGKLKLNASTWNIWVCFKCLQSLLNTQPQRWSAVFPVTFPEQIRTKPVEIPQTPTRQLRCTRTFPGSSCSNVFSVSIATISPNSESNHPSWCFEINCCVICGVSVDRTPLPPPRAGSERTYSRVPACSETLVLSSQWERGMKNKMNHKKENKLIKRERRCDREITILYCIHFLIHHLTAREQRGATSTKIDKHLH